MSDTPRLDAELLGAHALGMSRAEMLLRQRDLQAPDLASELVERRMAHEPVAYITGHRDFWTLTLTVTPDVLIPRPDSETLIEVAVGYYRNRGAPVRILDLGTGSGALLLATLDAWPGATGLGVDASPSALDVARENAERCGLADRAAFVRGDWGNGLADRFDLILCNPPYIRSGLVLAEDVRGYEPHAALFGGLDGLDAYRRIAPQVTDLLMQSGIALFEIGFDQGESVPALFASQGLMPVVHRDLAGQDRCVAVTSPA